MSHPQQHRQTNWQDIKIFKDEPTGVQFRIRKGDQPKPVLSVSVGFTHGQTKEFAVHSRNLINYHTADVETVNLIDPIIEALQRMRDTIKADTLVIVKEIEKAVPKPQPKLENRPRHKQHVRAPGKTAKKKEKIMAARQTQSPPNGTPAAS